MFSCVRPFADCRSRMWQYVRRLCRGGKPDAAEQAAAERASAESIDPQVAKPGRDDLLVADRSLHEAHRASEPAHPGDRLFEDHGIVVRQIALDHVCNHGRLLRGKQCKPDLLTVMSILLYYGIVFMERTVVPWAPRN
jgi:hypothetical protein